MYIGGNLKVGRLEPKNGISPPVIYSFLLMHVGVLLRSWENQSHRANSNAEWPELDSYKDDEPVEIDDAPDESNRRRLRGEIESKDVMV